jgi:hypothetical protein
VFSPTSTGSATPRWTLTGTIGFGASVSGAGDVDGLRFDDMLVGGTVSEPGSGEVFLYHGGRYGLTNPRMEVLRQSPSAVDRSEQTDQFGDEVAISAARLSLGLGTCRPHRRGHFAS